MEEILRKSDSSDSVKSSLKVRAIRINEGNSLVGEIGLRNRGTSFLSVSIYGMRGRCVQCTKATRWAKEMQK